MEKARELVPSLSPAQNTASHVPVCVDVGRHEKAEMSGARPLVAAKVAPAGRPVAQSWTASSLGSVAVTVRLTRLL